MSVKQVIVFRRDLKVRKGKIAAQAGHASIAFIMKQFMDAMMYDWHDPIKENLTLPVVLTVEQQQWIKDLQVKISLVVDGEKELQELHAKARGAGLNSHMIVDAGLTEFHGVPTLTCIVIGPHESERIDAITAGLDLF